jgi:hypothetical protein
MEIVVKIDFGFGKRDVRWDGRVSLEKGRITRAAGRGFDRKPGDRFDGETLSWRSTTLGRGPEYAAKYEELVRLAGEHGHYYDDAISLREAHGPASITLWLETDEADTLVLETEPITVRWPLRDLLAERKATVPVDDGGSRIHVSVLKPDLTRTTRTENVVIAILDGLRAEDAFGPTFTMPGLVEKLVPRGTFLPNFVCDGDTITGQAHATMLTGTPQDHVGNSGQIRPNKPTIFEYHKMIETPSNPINHDPTRCVLVAGKGRVSRMNYSTFESPLLDEYGGLTRDRYYGPLFGASVYAPADFERFPSAEDAERARTVVAHSTWSEAATWAVTRHVIEDVRPSLLVVNFGEMDEVAHAGIRWTYDDALRRLDRIAVALWELLEQSDTYAARTTLLVTTDHGRHDLEHGGFQHHGCDCPGCRRCFLLAIGPDTPAGCTVETRHNFLDLAPTIGALLGFATPEAHGRPLPILATP